MAYFNPKWLSSGYISKMEEIKNNHEFSRKDGDEHHILEKDLIEDKPSFLSDLVTGSSGNGWVSFKNEKKQTLDDLFRSKK